MASEIKNLLGPAQFAIYCAILLLSTGIAYATIRERLNTVEKVVASLQTDHELLVKINTQIEFMSRDIKELKADMKTHLMKEIK